MLHTEVNYVALNVLCLLFMAFFVFVVSFDRNYSFGNKSVWWDNLPNCNDGIHSYLKGTLILEVKANNVKKIAQSKYNACIYNSFKLKKTRQLIT